MTDATERPTPKAWLQQYLGVAFPKSAQHFMVYYRSVDKDVVLFSFDIAGDNLQHLMNGKSVFPHYDALVRGNSGVPSDIACDYGSRQFVQRIAALKNVFSVVARRTEPPPSAEVQLWTAQVSIDTWRVCVSVRTDKRADRTIARSSFQMPGVPLSADSCVVVNSPLGGGDDTRIWQRWSLDAAGYRQFRQTMDAAGEVARYVGIGAEALADRLNARSPAAEVSWWMPSALTRGSTGVPDSVPGFCRGGDGTSTALVIGRVDGLFRGYAYTQGHVLTPDPCDAIWGWLGLSLPASARRAHYESSSNLAGVIAWIRFDLPPRDLATCLAQTSALPTYSEFMANVVLKEYLEDSYQTDAPPWWCPQELDQGLYAQRRTNTRELADISVGLAPLSPGITRVYIGVFSPW